MKNTRYMFYTLCAGIALSLLASCSDRLDDCNCSDTAGNLALRVTVPQPKVMTRATEPGVGNENAINSLKLYFFEGETMKYNTSVATPVALETDILLPVDAGHTSLFQGAVAYTVYAVANLSDDLSGKTLTQFKETVVNKTIGSTTSGDFVMVASVIPAANLKLGSADNRIGWFELKREAVKIRMKLAAFNVTGLTAGQPTIQLKNKTDRGYIDKEELPADAVLSDETAVNLNFGDTSDPMYGYPNFWTEDNQGTYIHLTVPITKAGETKNHHYRVPVNGDNREIKANHLYDITVTVNRLGSLDPATPAPIDAFFSVKDWSENAVSADIKTAHYLQVAETYVEMKNITDYRIDYSTSDPVEIVNVKGEFIYVSNQTGQPVTAPATGDQVPTVTLEAGNKIKIHSKVPVNYIPKKITFTVRHTTATGIDPVPVTVWQYPPTFITHTTGIASSWRPSGQFGPGESHLKNKSIYRITNLVPSDLPSGAVLGFPPTTQATFHDRTGPSWSYSYPVEHTDHITADSEETANMISPNFEMASQLGATQRMGYKTYWNNTEYLRYYDTNQGNRYALHTCALYTETRVENGVSVVLSDWRLPTRAEIQLIDRMQAEGTAVTEILKGRYYWSGLSDEAIEITHITPNSGATKYNAHVRCVRDVKQPPLNN